MNKIDLRAAKIYNAWDIAHKSGTCVWIDYYAQDYGRGGRGAARWMVCHTKLKTDKDAHWMDNHNKAFVVSEMCPREQALKEAMKWTTDIYGAAEWERSPFGSWHPKGSLTKALKGVTG